MGSLVKWAGAVALLHEYKRPKREPPAPAFEPVGTGDDQPGGAAACGLGRPRKASLWSDLRHEGAGFGIQNEGCAGAPFFFFLLC